jgi:YesN/AraC family two-component response regulator
MSLDKIKYKLLVDNSYVASYFSESYLGLFLEAFDKARIDESVKLFRNESNLIEVIIINSSYLPYRKFVHVKVNVADYTTRFNNFKTY